MQRVSDAAMDAGPAPAQAARPSRGPTTVKQSPLEGTPNTSLMLCPPVATSNRCVSNAASEVFHLLRVAVSTSSTKEWKELPRRLRKRSWPVSPRPSLASRCSAIGSMRRSTCAKR